jgi:hypothetical protein
VANGGDRRRGCLRLSGGSVTIDLGLSATITRYIENGVVTTASSPS